MRRVDTDYQAVTGEVVFSTVPTTDQLNSSFPGYASAVSIASILSQIAALEISITPRMIQEAASGSTLTGLGPENNLTSAQWIANVRGQIATLRTQLT